jgi:hypothetical protein
VGRQVHSLAYTVCFPFQKSSESLTESVKTSLTRRAQLYDLDPAWRAYQGVRRSLWLLAPHIERRFFRTQDASAYQLEYRKRQQIAAAAGRGWLAACRRVHPQVQIIPVGVVKHGLVSCFLVRVPKNKRASMLVDEYVFGAPREDDVAAHEQLRAMREYDDKVKKAHRAQATIATLHHKMLRALAAARHALAQKHHLKEEREKLVREENKARWNTLSGYMYAQHHEHMRKMRIAVDYRDKLAAHGLRYDLANIETPVDLKSPQ